MSSIKAVLMYTNNSLEFEGVVVQAYSMKMYRRLVLTPLSQCPTVQTYKPHRHHEQGL